MTCGDITRPNKRSNGKDSGLNVSLVYPLAVRSHSISSTTVDRSSLHFAWCVLFTGVQ